MNEDSQESSVDPNKCVICHKSDPTNNIIGKVQERQALKRAAFIRNDDVMKRLKILEEQKLPVVYLNSNKSYKCYTNKKALDSISSKREARDDSENIESDHDSGVEQVI